MLLPTEINRMPYNPEEEYVKVRVNATEYIERILSATWEWDEVFSWRKRIRCKHIVYIWGNHDFKEIDAQKSSNIFEEVHDIYRFNYNHKHFVCCHYPMLSWPRSNHGSYHLHGHSHGKVPFDPSIRRIDVGFDANGGKWVQSIDDIIEKWENASVES